MDVKAALAFVQDQVPVRNQILLPPAFRTAYQSVAAFVKDTPFMKVPSAEFNRGRLITWAVDHAVENLIKSGQWSVDYRWLTFGAPKATGSYLEILPPHSRITISQIADPTTQPRNVHFRANARLFNNPLLPFAELVEEKRVSGRPGILLIHGHQDLSFLHFGLPHAVRKQAYICKTVNLLHLPYEITHAGPAVEDTSFEGTMTLKEEIAKWLRDHRG